MNKTALVTHVIESRIANADHLLEGIPSERRMSEELGVSRTTVRSAVQGMIRQGVLSRKRNGRLAVSRSHRPRPSRSIGLVMPSGASPDLDLWRQGVSEALAGTGVLLRPVIYAHIADSAITEALTSFDGIFFIPPTQDLPDWLPPKLRQAPCRVVVLDQDESDAGLPSVIMFPPASERKLLDHLAALGHGRIDCLITQQDNDLDHGRVGVWRQYLDEKGLTGHLHALMVGEPLGSAYRMIHDVLSDGRRPGSALFCTSVWAAIGAMRALAEAGFDIGHDISVCAVNDEGIGRYLLKTLTALQSPPRHAYLRKPAAWILDGSDWEGSLLIQPDDVPLFVGESTGPPSMATETRSQPKPQPRGHAS